MTVMLAASTVAPQSAADNPLRTGVTYAVFLRQFVRRHARRVLSADFRDRLAADLHEAVGLAGMGRVLVAPLRHHIARVICLCAQKQVRRVHARGVVAGMTNDFIVGDTPVMQLPSEPMGIGAPSINVESPVTRLRVGTALPHPAVISPRIRNEAPEPFFGATPSGCDGALARTEAPKSVPEKVGPRPELLTTLFACALNATVTMHRKTSFRCTPPACFRTFGGIITLLALYIGCPVGATSPQSDFVVGNAVFYSANFDNGGWDVIVRLRKAWGQLPENFQMPDGAYHCAHPDYALGTVLRVQNAMTGTVIRCVVVDKVAPVDVAHWKANAVIELSYAGFGAVDCREANRVVVWKDGGP